MTQILPVLPDQKNVVITGGYGHLGGAITESLASHGAVVFVLSRNEDKFNEVFAESSNISNIHFEECDISISASIESALQKVAEKVNRIDGIINNAFYAKGQSPLKMERSEFNYTLDGSLSSVFDVIKHAVPYLSDGASVINVSSMYGMIAPDFDAYQNCPEYLNPPHYGAAKAGVIQLSKYYASLLGKRGIRVNSVSPGPFPNVKVQKNEEFMAELKKRTLLNRFGLPEDLAGIFVFLMGDGAKYITGQNFVVDGGWTVR